MLTDQQLIDKYIRNKLSPDDTELFELKSRDPKFSALVSEHKLLKSALGEVEAENLKKMLQNHEAKSFKSPNNTTKYKWAFVLGILLLASAVVIYIMSNPSPIDKNELYAQYYSPYPNVVDPITKGNENQLTLFQLYEMKKYNEVIFMLGNQATKSTDQMFYLANAYMAVNKFDEAEVLFSQLSSTTKYSDQSQWFTSLLCLKKENDDCLTLFQKIANTESSFYRQKASELARSMD